MPNGKSLMTPTKKSPNLTTVTATPSRAWGREGETPSGLRTFYVASICRGGATLGETIIVMSDHFLQNSTDHFAVTQKRKKLHCDGCFPSQIWKEPKSSVEKRRDQIFLVPLQDEGGASWSTSTRMRVFPFVPQISEV